MSDFVEPWKPRAGQRVRIRLSAECERPNTAAWPAISATFPKGHHPDSDGLLACVLDPRYDLTPAIPLSEIVSADGHHYRVGWDAPLSVPGHPHPIGGDRYAACELEPVGPVRTCESDYGPNEADGDPYVLARQIPTGATP